tara:strand:- start:1042 stop:1251 length:210 start_codon:yes stop_codon:yes gene_type:complete
MKPPDWPFASIAFSEGTLAITHYNTRIRANLEETLNNLTSTRQDWTIHTLTLFLRERHFTVIQTIRITL